MILSLFLDIATNLPIFGKLLCTVSKDFNLGIDHVFVLVQKYVTLGFEQHLHCYSVRLTEEFDVLKFNELIDYHPLDSYRAKHKSDYYIIPRYMLF